MLNKQIYLGDAEGDGHHVTLTLFDTGSLVIASFNPDGGTFEQIVLQPQQWQAAMKIVIDSLGIGVCPYSSGPHSCEATNAAPPRN